MNEITTVELKAMMDKKEEFTFLDCRRKESFDREHLPGAINLRWNEIMDRAKDMLPPKSARVITYCSDFTCDASILCYKNLKKLGFTKLLEYSGGLEDWKAHGYETSKT